MCGICVNKVSGSLQVMSDERPPGLLPAPALAPAAAAAVTVSITVTVTAAVAVKCFIQWDAHSFF